MKSVAYASGTYALIRVPDELAAKVGKRGIPLHLLLEHVVAGLDSSEAISRYEAPVEHAGPQTDRPASWTRESLHEFLNELPTQDFEPRFLLSAYADSDTPRARGIALREACGFEADATSKRIWELELQRAKRRLTTLTNETRKPALFSAPYGTGDARTHPIHPQVHQWLREWQQAQPRGEPPLRWATDPRTRQRHSKLLASRQTASE